MSGPRWLEPDEQETWRQLLRLLAQLPVALEAQLRRDAGLTAFEYHVLALLSEQEERVLRMSTLASYAEGSLPRLSQVVARLESRGYVQRSPDPADGRYTLARLTEAGWDKVIATAPGHVAEVRRLVLDPLTRSQVRELGKICGQVTDAIDGSDC